MTKFKDNDILQAMSKALDYDNKELGIKPNYTFGVNSYLKQIVGANGTVTTTKIDISGKPNMIGCHY